MPISFSKRSTNFIKLNNSASKFGIIKSIFSMECMYCNRVIKLSIPEVGRKHKIDVPYSHIIFSTAEIPALKDKFTYPLVVKGKYYDAAVAYTPEQAVSTFNKISAKWGLPIIIQQFVHGQEVNVTAIGDGKGATIGAVAMRKTYITDKGKAWAGISI